VAFGEGVLPGLVASLLGEAITEPSDRAGRGSYRSVSLDLLAVVNTCRVVVSSIAKARRAREATTATTAPPPDSVPGCDRSALFHAGEEGEAAGASQFRAVGEVLLLIIRLVHITGF
jgi:hypothetical protein